LRWFPSCEIADRKEEYIKVRQSISALRNQLVSGEGWAPLQQDDAEALEATPSAESRFTTVFVSSLVSTKPVSGRLIRGWRFWGDPQAKEKTRTGKEKT
jgi:hypothetical protein